MTDNEYFDLLANIKAVELIVVGLFAKWASEAPDPTGSAERMIEAIIGSLHASHQASDEGARLMFHKIEDHLRHILSNALIRLSD